MLAFAQNDYLPPPSQMTQEEFNQRFENLTGQEKRVLKLFLEGKNREAIADALTLSVGCIGSHLSNIYRKFNLIGYSQQEELIHLFIQFKAEWVAPSRRQQVGHPALEFPNGSVPLNSYFYIQRGDIEKRCYQNILNPGALIRIKASKFMGKTSLLLRILADARIQNIRTVEINFATAEQEIFNNLEQFLLWFCFTIGEQLNLENRLEQSWSNSLGGIFAKCADYFKDYLLPEINCPLVLALDEVDRIFPLAYARDFFSLLRNSFHEAAKTNPILGNLRIVLAYSTEVYIEIQANESPFNVGVPVELEEFSHEQVRILGIRHQLRLDDDQIKELMKMVGGHPYLIRLAFYHLADNQQMSLTQLLQEAPTKGGIYSNHLRGLWETLHQNPDLAQSYQTVINATNYVDLDPMQTHFLSSLGLIKVEGNKVRSRNELYRQYFSSVGF